MSLWTFIWAFGRGEEASLSWNILFIRYSTGYWTHGILKLKLTLYYITNIILTTDKTLITSGSRFSHLKKDKVGFGDFYSPFHLWQSSSSFLIFHSLVLDHALCSM
jgi:hypothetical protein